MPRLFLGNFDFEHELCGDSPSRRIRRLAAELSASWLSIAEAGDVIRLPEPPEAEFLGERNSSGLPAIEFITNDDELARLVAAHPFSCAPWGWSETIAQWSEQHGFEVSHPALDVVRTLNSRSFSFQCEQDLGGAIERSTKCKSLDVLKTAISRFRAGEAWVVKAEFGMSARERILGNGPDLNTSQLGWLKNRWNAGRAVFVEPWLISLAEAGLQFEIPREPDADPQFLGVTPMLTDNSGVYRGSRFDALADSDLNWENAIETGFRVAERAKHLGYFGPLGIDAMIFENSDGTSKLRPIQDINARWTMGRLSLGFRKYLSDGEHGVWLHVRCPAESIAAAREWWSDWESALPQGVRGLRISPLTLGRRAVEHASVVLTATEPHLLNRCLDNMV